MIGVFDSGYGGLTILHGLIETLPDYDYIYLGDNARAPYGSRPASEIIEYTRQGVTYLFEHGCPLVLLGCNTASAVALRSLQQNFLVQHYPDRRILGIVVPTIEQISEGTHATIGLLATEQTIASGTYSKEIHKRNPDVQLIEQPAPRLVKAIEEGADSETIKATAKQYLDQLFEKAKDSTPPLSAIVLGCTHFEIIADVIKKLLPPDIALYEQPKIVAKSLQDYLQRHPEMETRLTKNSRYQFLTTADPETISHRSSRFFGKPIPFEKITL